MPLLATYLADYRGAAAGATTPPLHGRCHPPLSARTPTHARSIITRSIIAPPGGATKPMPGTSTNTSHGMHACMHAGRRGAACMPSLGSGPCSLC